MNVQYVRISLARMGGDNADKIVYRLIALQRRRWSRLPSYQWHNREWSICVHAALFAA